MSLWLPRPSPILLARSYNHSARHVLRSQLFSSGAINLPLPTIFPAHHTNFSPSHRRLQSTKPSSNLSPTSAAASGVSASPPATKDAPKAPLMTRVWKKVKHEAAHYWHGSKLLVSEARISSRLQWKILHGDTLTRRERRQVRFLLYLCFLFM